MKLRFIFPLLYGAIVFLTCILLLTEDIFLGVFALMFVSVINIPVRFIIDLIYSASQLEPFINKFRGRLELEFILFVISSALIFPLLFFIGKALDKLRKENEWPLLEYLDRAQTSNL